MFVKRLTETATLPKRGSAFAAGYDLYADLGGQPSITVPPCSYVEVTEQLPPNTNLQVLRIPQTMRVISTGSYLVSTGISVAIPHNCYGRVASRSGLATKGIEVGAGVIDSDYRGEVKVLLRNLGGFPFEIKHGDRIAQLIIENIITPEVVEVKDLDQTVRGSGGFGSTGVSSESNSSHKNVEKPEKEYYVCSGCAANYQVEMTYDPQNTDIKMCALCAKPFVMSNGTQINLT